MHISNDRYFRERQRHDLALRMIRHEARTCTIKACTGLTDDRIRRLCKTYEIHATAAPLRRRRGKAPRQLAFFTRNVQVQFESACLTSVFCAFGLLQTSGERIGESLAIEYGALFCDAFETHRQLAGTTTISFEHAWFLLQQLNDGSVFVLTRCRQCHGQFLRDPINARSIACPTCRLKKPALRKRRPRFTPSAAVARRSPKVGAHEAWRARPEADLTDTLVSITP
jgi:DNA-directed RNA polymerase subunit RPC12/RpoP